MLPVKQLAELKVTEWLLAGIPYENMPALADDFVCNSGGRTAWFRRHVRQFVEQELAAQKQRQDDLANTQRWLETLPEVEPGIRFEYTKTRKGKCWRFFRNAQDVMRGYAGFGRPVYRRDLPDNATVESALLLWKQWGASDQ